MTFLREGIFVFLTGLSCLLCFPRALRSCLRLTAHDPVRLAATVLWCPQDSIHFLRGWIAGTDLRLFFKIAQSLLSHTAPSLLTILGFDALQVCLGYFLMLIAMTYEAELFIMVVLGLAVGHWLFNILLVTKEEIVDPCCAC